MKRREFLMAMACALPTAHLGTSQFAHALLMDEEIWVEYAEPMMGTIVRIGVYVSQHENLSAKARADLVTLFDELRTQIATISNWSDSSLTAQLNRGEPVIATPQAIPFSALQALAHSASQKFPHAVISYARPLSQLWRTARSAGELPDRADIRHALSLARSTRVVSTTDGSHKLLGGGGLDLDGFAPGYFADYAAAWLKSRGYQRARIDCGGELTFLGSGNAKSGAWDVAIEHPRSGPSIGTLRVYRGAVATSGDSETVWYANGERLHHLLDPQSGYPAQNSIQATVVAPTASEAEGLGKACFALPWEAAQRVLARDPNTFAVVVNRYGKLQIAGNPNVAEFLSDFGPVRISI